MFINMNPFGRGIEQVAKVKKKKAFDTNNNISVGNWKVIKYN